MSEPQLIAGVANMNEYQFQFVKEFESHPKKADEKHVCRMEFVFAELEQAEAAIYQVMHYGWTEERFKNDVSFYDEVRAFLLRELRNMDDEYWKDYYWHLRKHYDEKLAGNMMRKAERRRAVVTDDDIHIYAEEVCEGVDVYDRVYEAFLAAYDAGKPFVEIHEEVQRKVFTDELYPAEAPAQELFGDVQVMQQMMHYVAKRKAYTDTIKKYKYKSLRVDDGGKLLMEEQKENAGRMQKGNAQMKPSLAQNFFKPSIRMQVTTVMKDFFAPTDQPLFEELVRDGVAPARKIVFIEEGNKLLDAFRQLYEAHLVVGGSKKVMERWICDYFQYSSRGVVKDFSIRYVHRIMAENNSPCKKPLIEVENKKEPEIRLITRKKKT